MPEVSTIFLVDSNHVKGNKRFLVRGSASLLPSYELGQVNQYLCDTIFIKVKVKGKIYVNSKVEEQKHRISACLSSKEHRLMLL
jgi:hypothetical protein